MECEFGPKTQAYKEGLKFIVDPEDYDKYVKPYKFHLSHNGYVVTKKRGSSTSRLARMIMNVLENKTVEVDHKNRNPLDNRKSNMRVCTKQENMMNKDKPKTNTSGFKCVHWREDLGKYCSLFRYMKKKYYVGVFDDPQEAYEAYIKKLREVSNDSKYIYEDISFKNTVKDMIHSSKIIEI